MLCYLAMFLCKLFLTHIQCGSDNRIHVIIFVLTETSAKDYFRLLLSQLFILCIELSVLLIINRIIWLISRFPLGAVLTADYGLRKIIALDRKSVV